MRLIDRVKTALTRRTCGQCGGKGYVVDKDVDAFIQRYGLAAYQVSTALMTNEIEFGGRGSIGVGAWEMVGLDEAGAHEFATDVGNVHTLHSCPSCSGQRNHPSPLKTAIDTIDTLKAERQEAFRVWSEQRKREPAGE